MLINMIRKYKRAKSFTLRDWFYFIQSWMMLLFVDLWLKIGSFHSLSNYLTKDNKVSSSADTQIDQDSESEIRELVDLVDTAGRNHIVRMSCLRRTMVQKWLLNKKGISTDLRFGVRTVNGSLQAHAWLERDGKIISDPEIIRERYATLLEVSQAIQNGSVSSRKPLK